MGKRHTEEDKKLMVSLYVNGKSVQEICEKNQISRSALYNWIKLYTERKAPKTGTIISGHRIVCLEEENRKLREENEILKKASCGCNASRSEKIQAVQRLYGQYSLRALCDALELARGTFYNHMKSQKNQKLVDRQNEEFRPIIRKIFEDSKGRLGARPIRAKMHEMEYEISVRRINYLMKEMKLSAVVPKPDAAYMHPRSKFYRNKLSRNFDQTEANKVWASDITYVPVGDKFYYVCVILDLFSRRVLSYSVSDRIDTNLTIKAFMRAYKLRNQPQGLLFHSDQGCQYTSFVFQQILKGYHVEQSFSTPGQPHDNAVLETFFSAFKKEQVYRNVYRTKEELEASVAEYIEFYNEDRPHRKLNMKTPAQFEAEYFSALNTK